MADLKAPQDNRLGDDAAYVDGGAEPKNVQELTGYIQTMLQQMQERFQNMSDQIIARIDDMGARIDDLEHNINDLMAQAGTTGSAGPPALTMQDKDQKYAGNKD